MNPLHYSVMKYGALRWTLLLLSCIAPIPALSQPPQSASVIVTNGGPVRGILNDGIREYLGIPYAAAPVGLRRWALPAPAPPWKRTLDARAFRNGCPQVARYGTTQAGYNEDCLFVNVAVPPGADARHARPVIAWIYGGAFVGGSSALYPLSHVAQSGNVVVVSFNYRLGVFGFMAHPAFGAATNGGYGLEDQRAALRWVQRNIAKFGGDPHEVTVAGESAGAASICMHVLAPKETTGLFARAVIMSGGCVTHLRSVAVAGKVGSAVGVAAGCPGAGAAALACLRGKSVKTLVEAGARVGGADIMSFVPAVGTVVVPEQGALAMKTGDFVRVPIINGGDTQELRLYVAYAQQAGAPPVSPANYRAHLQVAYPGKADLVLKEYPLSAYSSPSSAFGSAMSDFIPTNGLNNCIDLEMAKLASAYVPIYEYEFADPNPPPVTADPGWEMGAVHSSELPYFFPNFSNTTFLDGPDLAPRSQDLATTMMSYWTSFARTGTPEDAQGPTWTPFITTKDVLRFEPGKLSFFHAASAHHCEFWHRLYPNILQ